MDEKGIETLGADFVLDRFHIQEYIRRMARLAGGTEEKKKKTGKKYRDGWKKEAGKNWRDGLYR